MQTHSNKPALIHLFTALSVIVLACAATYVVPGLNRFAPYTKGDSFPMARLFKQWGEIPAFAGAGGAYRSTPRARDLSKDVGTAVAANIGKEVTPSPTKTSDPRVMVSPAEYEGIEVFIEDASGDAMTPFYRSLLATVKGKQITRVGHYGDSSIATDLITHTLRLRLQKRFGDSGHGFVLMARGYLPYRHRQVYHRANDRWLVKELVRKHDRRGHYGYGGVQFLAQRGARAVFGTDDDTEVGNRVAKFEIYYQEHPGGGDISIRVDKQPAYTLSTRAESLKDAVHTVRVTDGEHRLQVRNAGGGPSRMYGVVLERNTPGVVYDSLGLVGARGLRLLNFDTAHIRRQLARRNLALLVIAFGGNEASDNKTEESYYKDYLAIIDKMRDPGSEVSCLVMSPLDQASRRRGRITTLPTIPRIISAQRRAAADRGCAFFNTFEAMGGKDSMGRWYRARPRLAMGDFRHATPLGYETIGNLFYKALLAGFSGFLKTEAAQAEPNSP